jgi:hypothetical protein
MVFIFLRSVHPERKERGSGFASEVNGRMLAASGAWRLFPLFAVGNRPKAAPARRATCQRPTAAAVSAFGTRLPAGVDNFGVLRHVLP